MSEEKKKKGPAFLHDEELSDSEEVQNLPDVVSQGGEFSDAWVLEDGQPFSPRHREMCRLLASGKWTQRQVARHLNFNESWISVLKKNPRIQKEMHRVQERMFVEDFTQRMKDLTNDALDVVEETIRDTTGAIKPAEKQAAAKWLIEKTTGKAVQVHDVGESTLASVLDAIDRLHKGKPLSPYSFDTQAKDVTGTAGEEKGSISSVRKWVQDEI